MESILNSLIRSNLEPVQLAEIDVSNTDISEMVEHIPKNKIRHLVFSGGGAWGLFMYGILSEAVKYGFVEKSNIRTIHCTSVGSVLAVMFSLNYEEGVIQDYLIKRPWKTVFKRGSANVFQIYETYGFLTSKVFEDLFDPLFTALDLTIALTLKELYEYTGVEIHMYCTELNQYKLVDISYKTHPDWRVCDAVYASCTVPILFSPIIDEVACYLDGGLLANYPIRQLMDDLEKDKCSETDNAPDLDEIFGINIIENTGSITITKNVFITIEQFLFCIFYKLIEYFGSFQIKPSILHEIKVVKVDPMLSFTYNSITSAEYRENIIHRGKQMFRENAKKWWGQPGMVSPGSASPTGHTDNILLDNSENTAA